MQERELLLQTNNTPPPSNEQCSLFSWATFRWVNHYFTLGYRHYLEQSDIVLDQDVTRI